MKCGDTRKFNCGTKTEAVCTYYRGYLPKYSKLDTDCVVIEETTEELYKNQEYILKSIDTSKLTNDCIDYDTVESDDSEEEGKILIVEVLQKMQDEICKISGKEEDQSISNLDFKCLVDPCENQITSIKSLFQILINEICDLKNN